MARCSQKKCIFFVFLVLNCQTRSTAPGGVIVRPQSQTVLDDPNGTATYSCSYDGENGSYIFRWHLNGKSSADYPNVVINQTGLVSYLSINGFNGIRNETKVECEVRLRENPSTLLGTAVAFLVLQGPLTSVTELKVTSNGNNSFSVRWEKPNLTENVSYHLDIYDNSNNLSVISECVNETEYCLPVNLHVNPCGNYSITVIAVNKAGDGDPNTITGFLFDEQGIQCSTDVTKVSPTFWNHNETEDNTSLGIGLGLGVTAATVVVVVATVYLIYKLYVNKNKRESPEPQDVFEISVQATDDHHDRAAVGNDHKAESSDHDHFESKFDDKLPRTHQRITDDKWHQPNNRRTSRQPTEQPKHSQDRVPAAAESSEDGKLLTSPSFIQPFSYTVDFNDSNTKDPLSPGLYSYDHGLMQP